MHQAAFVLPQYIKKELNDVKFHQMNKRFVTGYHEKEDDGQGDRCILSGCIII